MKKYGLTTILHKGKKLTTTVGNLRYESMFSGRQGSTNATIPAGYEHRPDLISSLFDDSPATWWIFCERNAIFDVFEEINSGDSVRLPK